MRETRLPYLKVNVHKALCRKLQGIMLFERRIAIAPTDYRRIYGMGNNGLAESPSRFSLSVYGEGAGEG